MFEGGGVITQLRCSRCEKLLSRKTARLIDGMVLCSACLFPKLKGGVPQ